MWLCIAVNQLQPISSASAQKNALIEELFFSPGALKQHHSFPLMTLFALWWICILVDKLAGPSGDHQISVTEAPERLRTLNTERSTANKLLPAPEKGRRPTGPAHEGTTDSRAHCPPCACNPCWSRLRSRPPPLPR